MREYDVSNTCWRKSSYSSGDDADNCVEVADGVPDLVPIRDSKTPQGPTLLINAAAWQAFVTGLRPGPTGY
jgi:hypothetical protein